ncbi:hypothetical protein CJF30_00010975 [Rutstroemia sp. NJR-2017a BBW]|nr:hypothetical protein CJF30_00010975 [Rutstroemia sp. NJR-2017a BBW]
MDIESGQRNMFLNSKTHFALFKHDTNIYQSYEGQLEASHKCIHYLESKLQAQELCLRDYEMIQARLYESEKARTLEISARVRIQRHLKLEQMKSLEMGQYVRNLQDRLNKVAGEYTGLYTYFLKITSSLRTFNNMLQGQTKDLYHQVIQNKQEVVYNQSIINSLASEISLYEEDADKVLESLKPI